jgi:cell surface protein SprA
VKNNGSIFATIGILLTLLFCDLQAHAQTQDENTSDSTIIDLPLPHGGEDSYNPIENPGGISLDWPININYGVVYDPITGQYIVQQTIGDTLEFRPSSLFSLEEYLNYDMEGNLSEFWDDLQGEDDEANRAFAPKLEIDSELFEMLFGTNEIEIIPQGSAELTFGINSSNTENPRIPERQRRVTTFAFDQRIQLNITGKIGDKIELGTQYNTESLFDFENQMNIGFQGEEDDILKSIEAGNISLPLQGTLITGSQSLFGVKLDTQWGRLYNSTIISQQKGERKEIEVEGGAQTQEFDIRADDYEANRHYFLSQYFRNQYDNAMRSLPVPSSGSEINRIEVWVVNTQANTQDVRNIIAVTDLGEHPDYMSTNLPIADLTNGTTPTNNRAATNDNNDIFSDLVNNPDVMSFTGANAAINTMYNQPAIPGEIFEQGVHFERVGNARMLNPSEFSFNSKLGFISLRQSLNNAEVLGVSYEYTLDGNTYQVGTMAQDGFIAPGALVLKMLKSSITQLDLNNGDPSPLWECMMKNVYSMQAFGVSEEEFRLDVWYNDPSTGVDLNYIPRSPLDGTLLLQLLGFDRMDVNTMPNPDGVFDYVDNAATEGGTINSQNGRVFFPSVEPFGDNLRAVIEERVSDPNLAASLIQTLVFDALYDSTKTAAQQIPSLNRYHIKGQFQSQSSSEIALNALNVPEGSVTVTAGGVRLIENQDYTVDYNLGRVRIINDGLLESGQTIRVSLESNSLFNIQTKTLLGTRFDYVASDNFTIGATFLNMRERPLTQKVDIGDEPVNNTIFGTDFTWQTESRFLTDLVDKLPFYQTSTISTIDISGEAAYLIPGHSRAIGDEGNAYIDDFEGSQSSIDIRSVSRWFLASTPKLQEDLFPESTIEDSTIYNFNRAALSWYTIDPAFYSGVGLDDGQVSDDVRHDHRMRQILEQEIFPNRDYQPGTPRNIPTFDLSFWPSERGPYNYELSDGAPGYSAGLTEDGELKEPSSRWGGIQRALTTTDFESSNIEYIQFWVMDPFNDDSENSTGGDLYINLGNVSEDILNDSQLEFENGLPALNNPDQDSDTSNVAIYPDPSIFNVVNAFDNSSGSYEAQDVGLDGMNSSTEREFFGNWLSDLDASVAAGDLTPQAYSLILEDPSADDFRYFRNPTSQALEENILDRYKRYSRYEGNSNTSSPDGYPITATTIPNTEDINEDITLGTIESYYQYKISLRPSDLGEENVGNNYITDVFETLSQSASTNEQKPIKWYQFKIPVREYEKRVGSISDFRSIRFMRVFMKDFSQPVTIRFARMELIRGEWRKYDGSLAGEQEVEPEDPSATSFNISAVNIEENGNREPVPYITPPGISREIDVAAINARRLNEQSLSLSVCDLEDGDARGAYRNINYDMRMYNRLRMYFHAEPGENCTNLDDGDITAFVRLGSDFDANYYEYEIPLTVTPCFTSDADLIWPLENNMDIELQKLQNLKINRPTGQPLFLEYTEYDGVARMSVKGNPNLANVTTVMIGIRNPNKDSNVFSSSDDGLNKCAVVWANELRLSDFNEEGGWAAVARINATLADLGNFSLAANMSTPGWGGLEQRVQERQRETIRGVDANGTIQLGKLFPDKLGLSLPMYIGYSNQISTPQYDPLSPDIELADLELDPDRLERTKSVNTLKSINFASIKINPQGGKDSGQSRDRNDRGGSDKSDSKSKDNVNSMRGMGGTSGRGGAGGSGGSTSSGPFSFLKISNFTGNFSYNEHFQKDINTEFQISKEYRGGLSYNWQNRPKQYKPFSKIGFLSGKELFKWFTEFNFYLAPKQVSVNTQMERIYETNRVRNNTFDLLGVETPLLINTQVLKSWHWNRNYSIKYDLTQALKFDYSGSAIALVGEPVGEIDRDDDIGYQQYVETVMTNLMSAGDITTYNHNVNGSYKLPFDKIPLMNFVTGDIRYQSSFRWDRAPFAQDTLGATIQNSRNLSLNGQANFLKLYNRVPYLKKINNERPKKASDRNVGNERRDGFGNVEDEEEKQKIEIHPLKHILRFMMGVQNISGSFTRNEGILLPGYAESSNYGGFANDFQAPGILFLVGHQNTDIFGNRTSTDFAYDQAAMNGWLVQQPYLNQQYSETFTESFNVRLNIEPIKHFKIELTANRSNSRNNQSFFRYDEVSEDWVHESPSENGNFSATVMSWPTAFLNDDDNFSSDIWTNLLVNRLEISSRLNDINYNIDDPNPTGYYQGWGPTSQDVTIPAFMSAYLGLNPSDVSLDVTKVPVAPNWRISYDGLSKIPSLKKKFRRFNLSHTYRSTMSTSYTTNLSYTEDGAGLPTATDNGTYSNFISQRQFNTVSITEQLSPLIGLDMTLKTASQNEPQIKVELTRDRNVSFGLANYQITETKSKGIVVGVGYKFVNVRNPFMKTYGKLPIKLLKETDLLLRCDVNIRDNSTIIRKIEELQNQVTAGQTLVSIKFSADLEVSDKVTLRAFYDQQLTSPKISTSFATSNINSGFAIRFNLNQ